MRVDREKAASAWLGKEAKLAKVEKDAAALAKDYKAFEARLTDIDRDDLVQHTDALAFYDSASDNKTAVLDWLGTEPFSQETQRIAKGEAVEPAAPTDASTGETGVADAVKVETLPPPVQG